MKQITILILLVIFSLTAKSQLVIDNGEFLSEKESVELSTRLQNLKEKSTVETSIFTVMDLNGQTSLEYAMSLSTTYSIGRKGVNNGIIILLSKNDRRIQILVGFGLEWILSDNQTQEIVDHMVPFFKKGEFYNGLNKAIDLINEKVQNINWETGEFKRISEEQNGQIFKIHYTNETGITKYKYALESDAQFSDEFKIKIKIKDEQYNLYYSKYMNELVSKILTSDNITIYFKLSDYKNGRLELLGIE